MVMATMAGMAIDTIIMMTIGMAISGDGFSTMGATDMMTTTTLYRATTTMDSVTMATGGTATMMDGESYGRGWNRKHGYGDSYGHGSERNHGYGDSYGY